MTVNRDWYQNAQNQWCIAVEDDASQKILDMIEEYPRSGEAPIQLLNDVRKETADDGEILEAITDHGREFYANKRYQDGNADHSFEQYLANNIQHTLCAVGRPQSNGKIERYFQTYEKHSWRFDSLQEFLEYYNYQRPHQSLRYADLETPAEVFDRLLPTAAEVDSLADADEGDHGTKKFAEFTVVG